MTTTISNSKLIAILAMSMLASTAYAAPMDRIIDKLDTDGDGQISELEFQQGDRSIVTRLDSNNDDVVTLDEIDALIDEQEARMAERLETIRERLTTHFNDADIDADGSVTQEEARAAMFSRIDANEDGYVTADEIREARPERGRFGRRGMGPGHGNVPADEV